MTVTRTSVRRHYIPIVPMSINADDPAVFAVVDTSVIGDREVLPGQSPLMDNLRVDVTLNVSRDTWVRSPEANVEVYTPERYGALTIHVDRAHQALTLEGVVNADQGTTSSWPAIRDQPRSATFIGIPRSTPCSSSRPSTGVADRTGALDTRSSLADPAEPKLTLESKRSRRSPSGTC